MELQKLVGQEVKTTSLGKVEVLGIKPKSRTVLIVKNLERGKGYNAKEQKYTGLKSSGIDHNQEKTSSWSRGENHDYGNIDEIHKNEIL